MTFLKMLLGVVVVGMMLSAHTVPRSPASTTVVFIHAVWVDNPKLPVDKVITGAHVSGVSCLPKPTVKLPDAALCYVATDNN